LGFVVAVAGLLAIASPVTAGALAKKKAKKPGAVSTRSSTASGTGPSALVTATATCPKGTKAVGGGFLISPPNPGLGFLGLVYESQKVGQGSWRVSAQNLNVGPPQLLTVTADAYCRKGVPSTTTVSATISQPATSQTGPPAVAACTGKSKAVAGGFVSTPPIVGPGATHIMTDSLRTGSKTWLAQALSGPGAPNTVTSHAYCAKGKLPAAVASTSPPNSTPDAISTATATCKGKKKKLLMGGFSEGNVSSAPNSYLLPTESRRLPPNSWRATGYKVGNASGVTLTSSAYCG
jgi:hypothetical protein